MSDSFLPPPHGARRPAGRPAPRSCHCRGAAGRRRPAFTLVELLVVIGIIALLMSILLPSLARAREMAKQTVCLSNVRQLGIAFLAYVGEHQGRFPGSGLQGQASGWVYWDQPRLLSDSPIAPYLGGLQSTQALVCPSDDVTRRPGAFTGGPYPLSYAFNRFFTTDNGWQGVTRIQLVRNASEKVMLVEEDERTINDGRWEPHLGNYGANYPTGERGVDLIAIRHDRRRRMPDAPNQGGWAWVPNPDRKGNAAFADGHAESVARSQAHDKAYFDPKL